MSLDPSPAEGGRDPGPASLALTTKLAVFLIVALAGPIAVYSSAPHGLAETGLLCLSLVLVVTVGVTLFVGRPLRRLTAAIETYLETGALKRDLALEPRDEIGLLIARLQKMAGLQGIPIPLRESIGELGAGVGGLGEQLQQLASALREQTARLADARTTLRDLQRTSAWARTQAESVLEVMARAEDLSVSGRSSVAQGLQGLQQIRSQVDGIVEKIAVLGRQTGRVGGILETVKEVADQSHFLAVNATIEAARAGDLGKGFAVVAREVRTLADQSLRSSGQMQDLLDELHGAIGSAVSQTEGGASMIGEGVDRVRISGERLEAMSATLEQTGQAARQITASVGQQSEGLGRLSSDIDLLDRATIEVATGLAGVEKSADRLRSTSLGLSDLMAQIRR
jgi:methyl-accepting chemotaxis protein